ncbi:hypothetical protein REPUB_Repub07fG0047100 [Reevesia pubescens]
MEEGNKKLRKKAKMEYNETVSRLAEFVKKMDKRVIKMKEELERRKEDERERKMKVEKDERLERIRAYEELEWAKLEEVEGDGWDEIEEKGRENEGFYCVACGKKFKSEKQWKINEQSKKHKEKVAELRESLIDKEEEEEDLEVEEDVNERFRKGLCIEKEDDDVEKENRVGDLSEKYDGFFDVEEGDKKNASFKNEDVVLETKFHVKDESHEGEFMEYDNGKNTRRNRRGKKEKGKRNGSEAMKSDVNKTKSKNGEASVSDTRHAEEKQHVEN